MPNGPGQPAFQEEPNMAKAFQCLTQRLIEKALHHIKRFMRAGVTFFGKELPHNVRGIPPNLLCKWTTKGLTTLGGSDSHLCVVIGIGQLTHQS